MVTDDMRRTRDAEEKLHYIMAMLQREIYQHKIVA